MARTITLHKDAVGLLGFSHKDNLITSVMKESSASRNGLLINQRIVEVDGRNVMAFKNKKLKELLEDAPMAVTLTLMPAEFYGELTKKLVNFTRTYFLNATAQILAFYAFCTTKTLEGGIILCFATQRRNKPKTVNIMPACMFVQLSA
ncbi:unnamed protein product [Gongylonema pulchrum]|uniref:PDZ domain-containing protein n=1 Tax=Gongylonema pulchrum TaxID=637853 RepID=A0A3P7NQN4_9BILA|nr:unnamed protein product [Gongylonema pulchrum]